MPSRSRILVTKKIQDIVNMLKTVLDFSQYRAIAAVRLFIQQLMRIDGSGSQRIKVNIAHHIPGQ